MIRKTSFCIGIGIILLSQFAVILSFFNSFPPSIIDENVFINNLDDKNKNIIIQNTDSPKSPSGAITATLSIKIYDIDKGPLEQAKAHISGYNLNYYAESNIEGQITFSNLQITTYTLLITYANSFETYELFNNRIKINKTQEEFILNTNIRQIIFEISDVDGVKMNTGAVTLFNTDWTDTIHTDLMLDVDGQTKFIGLDRPETNPYHFAVSYINYFYSPAITPLVNATVHHKFLTTSTNFLSDSSLELGDGNFVSSMHFYAEGSTSEQIGTQKINFLTAKIAGLSDGYIWKVEIYGVNKNGLEELIESFESEFQAHTTQTWNYNKELWNCGRDYYGIRIKTYTMHPSRICSGEIQTTIYETFKEKVTVSMSSCKLIILDTEGVPVDGATIQIYNDTADKDTLITSLTTDQSGVAVDNNGNNFWYLSEYFGSIHISYYLEILCFGSIVPFSIFECGDQNLISFNFSIIIHIEMTFCLSINMNQYRTEIIPIEPEPINKLNYRDLISIKVKTQWIDACNIGTPFNAESIKLSLMDLDQQIHYLDEQPTQLGIGIYEFTFSPEQIGLILDENHVYNIKITAHTPGFGSDPAPFMRTIMINPIPSEIIIMKDNKAIEANEELYWGQYIHMDLIFHDTQTLSPISGAQIQYYASWNQWTYLIQEDKNNAGHYPIAINSLNVGQIGTYFIKILANKQNYAEIGDYQVEFEIKPLETSLNGTLASEGIFSDQTIHIYKNTPFIISLKYWDIINNLGIEDTSNAQFSWKYKTLDGKGTDSVTGSGNLIPGTNGIYLLEIQTETLPEGIYLFEVRLYKPNYIGSFASLQLTIDLLPINIDFGEAEFSDMVHYQAIQEKLINIKLQLSDKINNKPLIGAFLIMKLDQFMSPFEFTETSPGIYEYNFDTSQIDAFYQQQSLTGVISIHKADYTTVNTGVELKILMPEISSGIPKFYFYLGVGAVSLPIAAVGGTKLVSYARIPAHTKKIRRMKDIIRKNKSIPEGRIAHSAKEDFVQKHNKAWKAVGLDLNKTPKSFSTPKDLKGGL